LLATRVQSARSAGRGGAGRGTARHPDRLLAGRRADVISALHRGEYVRYGESKADQLRDAADLVRNRYDGDLRQLRAQAEGDVERLRELLTEFKGIGEVDTEIFLREVRCSGPRSAPSPGAPP